MPGERQNRRMNFTVTKQTQDDWPFVWAILAPMFRAGDVYPVSRDVSEADAQEYWLKTDGYNGVARDETGMVIGIYFLRPDQGGPGSHICNAGYVIAEAARGNRYATALCLQSQEQAREMGFTGMKFNLVVATNAAAIKAWDRAGLEIIGTVPKAFEHPNKGLVDAHIMFKTLT